MTATTLDKATSVLTSPDTKPKLKLDVLNIPSSFRVQGTAKDAKETVDNNSVPSTEKLKTSYNPSTSKATDQAILENCRCYLHRTQLLHLVNRVRLPELQGNVVNFLNSFLESTHLNFLL